MNRLEWVGLLRDLRPIDSRRATDDELALVHDRGYIDLVRREVAAGRYELSTGDTAICSQSDECARLAAGSVLSAVDAIFSGAVANTFCVVRPGGHHAGVAQGMGFCLYNSIAIAARYAQQRYATERILILDWDVNQGNGTQDIF